MCLKIVGTLEKINHKGFEDQWDGGKQVIFTNREVMALRMMGVGGTVVIKEEDACKVPGPEPRARVPIWAH